jgi:hypothetical protein
MADPAPFCGQCGEPTGAASLSGQRAAGEFSGGAHRACADRAVLEPPRYCPDCARRMVVQVDPMGWRAVCSRHGEQRG